MTQQSTKKSQHDDLCLALEVKNYDFGFRSELKFKDLCNFLETPEKHRKIFFECFSTIRMKKFADVEFRIRN